MKEIPLVSVVNPVKNGEEFLDEVLKSTLLQQTNFPYEVIVIDSGSRNDSLEIIKNHDVRLIQIPPHKFNHGLTRNLGVQESQGQFIAFLTQDATPVNNVWLQNLVSPLIEDSQVAGVFGKHIARTNCDPIVAINLQNHFDLTISMGKKCWQKDEGFSNNKGLYVFFSNNNSCIRKTVWQQIPFREVEMSEDQLWAQDILENGYLKCYEPNAVVYHSHTYSPIEWFQRQFDEYRAYKKMELVENVSVQNFIKNFVFLSVDDINKIINLTNLSLKQKIYWAFQRTLNNLGITSGQFFGVRYNIIPNLINKKLMSQQSRNMESK
ncbi:glycosyltransferase family 2 protein [Nostoc sp. UCD121]|uniref:glycosyltransferase n=1 Tax=Nostoc sp. UCD121 TaxID=2681305 RepID=UPI001623249B|nr:glycosyltransferase family 2 protein [Nostoc sp. UCD121]MBC1278336.1 glycosyltransferase family 2 protein [Nostoc sp. UCD121]